MALIAAWPSMPRRTPSFLSSSDDLPTPSSSTRTLLHACHRPLLSRTCLVRQGGQNTLLPRENLRRSRGDAVLVKAGPPSTTSLVFAFVVPLSLIIGTVLASIRFADKLDEKYLEELAMNQAIMEENEAEYEGDEDDDGGEENDVITCEEVASVEVATAPRLQNRPKKEV